MPNNRLDATPNAMPPRGNRLRAPYCWQEKTALRLIRDSLDSEASVATGLVVYLALCEVASDLQRDTFTATHLYIAGKCGLSPRTVRSRLHDLSEIRLIETSTPKLKAPSTFTLLAVPQPLPNDRQPLPSDRQPLPSDRQRTCTASLPPLERIKEESEECTEGGAKKKTKPLKTTRIDPRCL
jgi:hypothetical protein